MILGSLRSLLDVCVTWPITSLEGVDSSSSTLSIYSLWPCKDLLLVIPLGASSCFPPLKIIALYCSLGLGSDLLGSLFGGVDERLAFSTIWASYILLWVESTSIFEANCLIHSSCFCCAISILSIIASKLDFSSTWEGKWGLWKPGGSLALIGGIFEGFGLDLYEKFGLLFQPRL